MNGDLLDEVEESFTLDLSSAISATIADPQGAGTIADDDGTPSLSVNDVTVTEGNGGTVNAAFTVSLGRPAARRSASAPRRNNGPACAGDTDYVAADGNLIFAPGQTSQTFTVRSAGDPLDEFDEKFTST